MAWIRCAERLPADQQTVIICVVSPHYPGGIDYDVATFHAHGFADAIHPNDYTWARGAGWGFDRDERGYIKALAPIEPCPFVGLPR